MIDAEKYDAALLLEAAGRLDPQRQEALNALRSDPSRLPALPAWPPDHPHIRAAEQKYGIPPGQLGALLGPENAQGSTTAKSPTDVTGLFQVTVTDPDSPGARFGLNKLNRTNPYLNTDVAAKEWKRLLDANGGDYRRAFLGYKGHTPGVDMANDEYLRRYEATLADLTQRYQGEAQGAQPGASIVAAASPAPTGTQPTARDATPPLPLTATTTSPTSQTFGQETRQRAGFGPASASGIPGVLGQTLDNLNLGPFGPLLKVLGLPGAVVGTAVNQAGDSRTAGDVAQIGTDLLGGRVLAAFTPRARAARELSRLRVLNPGRTAETMEATAGNLRTTAVRDAAAKLGVTPQAIEKATGAAVQEARSTATRMSDRALAAARESDAAGVVPTPTPATPGRTITSPILNERGEPFTTRVPGQPARTVTPADVPPDLVGERAITRSLSDAAQHFARYVEKAETAATPKSAVDLLLRGAKVSGFGKAGVKLPAADAAAIEVQVGALVDKMLTASPTQGVKLLERAATLKGVDIPELTQAKALLADAESFKGQAAEVAARMDALQRYLQSPTLRSRVTHLLLPTPVRKLLAAAGAGAAGAAGYEAFRRD